MNHDFRYLTDKSEVESLIRSFSGPYLFIDTETTGLNTHTDKIVDVQVSQGRDSPVFMFPGEMAPELTKLNPKIILVGHNIKFDLQILYRNRINLTTYQWRDTLYLHHLLDENKNHDLDSIIKEYYNDPYKEEFWKKYTNYHDATLTDRVRYACKDVLYVSHLFFKFQEMLKADRTPDSLIDHVHALGVTLLKTEISGISIDKDYLLEKGVEVKSDIVRLQKEMRNLVNEECNDLEVQYWAKELDKRKTERGKAAVERPIFNFESSKQLMDLLYGLLQLPVQKNEKTKNISVDDASLSKLSGQHPIIEKIRDYREKNKVYNSYIEGTLERERNGRIYPNFNVCGTSTGRISHSNPNLGQLPRQGGIRGIYIPDSDYCLISADYSQLEICLAAHFSHDNNLLKIVNEEISQHDITAQSLGIDRNLAKTLNFAMQYRCSHFKVAKILSISEKEAQYVYNKYWETYSGLKRLMDQCDRKIDNGEPIVTLFGRKRHFERRKRQPWDKDYRMGFNSLIQGTGADLTSKAFYMTDGELRHFNKGYALFTVHDEILIASKLNHSGLCEQILIDEMEFVGQEVGLSVPLKVESSGPMTRWND